MSVGSGRSNPRSRTFTGSEGRMYSIRRQSCATMKTERSRFDLIRQRIIWCVFSEGGKLLANERSITKSCHSGTWSTATVITRWSDPTACSSADATCTRHGFKLEMSCSRSRNITTVSGDISVLTALSVITTNMFINFALNFQMKVQFFLGMSLSDWVRCLDCASHWRKLQIQYSTV